MGDSRDKLRTELLTDLEEKSRQGVLNGVDESLVDTVLEEHRPGADIDSLIGRFGMTYLVAEVVLSYFERQSLAVTHRSQWPPEDAADAVGGAEVSEDLLEALSDVVDWDGPETYEDVVETYLNLASDSLSALEYRTTGDRTTSSEVQVELELGEHREETTLHAEDREIDVQPLIDALNRLVEAATNEHRRFCRIEFTSGQVHVFFLPPDDQETMAGYLEFARAYGQQHATERGEDRS